jgi:hypothetical protein
VCYDFKDSRIVPTHYTIRSHDAGPHLRSWLIETSLDEQHWREVARQEDNEQLNGRWFTATFTVPGGEKCRFIRLVNIDRNHFENGQFVISAWEIFGTFFE